VVSGDGWRFAVKAWKEMVTRGRGGRGDYEMVARRCSCRRRGWTD